MKPPRIRLAVAGTWLGVVLLTPAVLESGARAEVLDLVGAIEMIGDPNRPLFLVSSGNDVEVIDPASPAAVIGSIVVPGARGPIAVDAGLDIALVADSFDVHVVDLSTRQLLGTIELTATAPLTAVVAGRPGRGYAINADSVFTLDTISRTQLSVVDNPVWTRSRLAISSSKNRLYAASMETHPNDVLALDVSTDVPCLTGRGPAVRLRDTCVELEGAPDNTIWYADIASEVALTATASPEKVHEAGVRRHDIVFSPAAGQVHATERRSIVTLDLATRCAFRIIPLSASNEAAERGLAATADGRYVGTLLGTGDLEVFDTSALPPNVGCLRVHCRDSVTGEGVAPVSYRIPWNAGATASRADVKNGGLLVSQLPAGPATIRLGNDIEQAIAFTGGTVIPGLVVDLPATRLVALQAADNLQGTITQRLIPGVTQHVGIIGSGFSSDTTLVGTSDVTVDEFSVVSATQALATLTVAPDIARVPQVARLLLQRPGFDVAPIYGRASDCSGADPDAPPLEVKLLKVQRRMGAPTRFRLTWNEVARDDLGGDEQVAWYEVSRSTAVADVTGAWQASPVALLDDDLLPDGGGSSVTYFRVRCRDISGQLGD